MIDDVMKLNFTRMRFNSLINRFEPSFVSRIINTAAWRSKEDEKVILLHELDLSAVAINPQIVNAISTLVTIRELTLEDTPGGSDRELKCTGLQKLKIVKNSQASLAFLQKDWARKMSSLEVIGCKEVATNRL